MQPSHQPLHPALVFINIAAWAGVIIATVMLFATVIWIRAYKRAMSIDWSHRRAAKGLPEVMEAPERNPRKVQASATARVRSTSVIICKLSVILLTVRALGIAMFGVKIETSIHIPRPRAKVWNTVLNMREWERWQPIFAIHIDGLPTVGKALAITCNWSNGAVDVANERIVMAERQRRLCWDWEDGPDWLLTTDRCITLADSESKGTQVINYETFSGPLAPFVYWFRGGVIEDGFAVFNSRLSCRLAARTCHK